MKRSVIKKQESEVDVLARSIKLPKKSHKHG